MKQAVTLTEPVLDEAAETLTYAAALVPTAGDENAFAGITCDGDAHLFIDDTPATASASSCPSTYNCFVGGFCSDAARTHPPAQNGYSNVYEHDTQDEGDAKAAGCNESPGDQLWTEGGYALYFVSSDFFSLGYLHLTCASK